MTVMRQYSETVFVKPNLLEERKVSVVQDRIWHFHQQSICFLLAST